MMIDNTFTDLYTRTGEDNILRKADNIMGYSNKAKAAEANADQKKDLFTIDQIEVTRAAEIKEDCVMFDMTVRGVKIYGMCLRHYKNDKGEGDIISFPSKQAKDGKYWDVAWFPISNDLKAGLIDKIVSLLG